MFRPLVCALGFLTRFPLPRVELSERDVARSAGYFAWVGALLGLLLWLFSRVVDPLGERLASLLLVALWAGMSGALHLDGLADTVDGLSGARGDPKRALEIMRDSRIGAHGATALVLGIALKWAALEHVRELGVGGWVLAPMVARFASTLLLATFPYAREQGLGSAFAKRVGSMEVALGSLLCVPVLTWFGLQAALSALVGLASAGLLAGWVRSRLGGLTGDVHGAAIEVCELAMLIALGALDLR